MAPLVGFVDKIAAYDNQGSWHGLRTEDVGQPESMEEAYRRSGLDWEVKVKPYCIQLETSHSDGEVRIGDESRFARAVTTMHGDVMMELGCVGMQYTPLQNIELFRAAQPFVDGGFGLYETAGSLRERRTVWVSLFIGTDYLDDDDPIAKKILFSNSHDGSSGLRVGFCPVRTECYNTLQINIRRGRFLTVRHTENVQTNFQEVCKTMDVVNKKWIATMDEYRKLTKIVVNDDTFERYVTRCFVPKLEEKIDEKIEEWKSEVSEKDLGAVNTVSKIEEMRAQLEKQFSPQKVLEQAKVARNEAPGARLKTADGTAWGAYNAVTYVLSHLQGSSREARTYGNLFGGEQYTTGARALALAMQL